MNKNRILKEKVYHNNRFSNEIREIAGKYYSISTNSLEFFNKQILNQLKHKFVLSLSKPIGNN